MDNSKTYSGAPTPSRTESALGPPASTLPPAAPVEFDNSATAAALYSNFCRLLGTPEELLIDFGLNPQPTGTVSQPVVLTQRVVTGWHTAKRLLYALQMAVGRHEAAFGFLETDVQKRAQRA